MGKWCNTNTGGKKRMTTQKEAKIFVEHIEKHLKTMESLDGLSREVQCRICGKGLTRILKEKKQQ